MAPTARRWLLFTGPEPPARAGRPVNGWQALVTVGLLVAIVLVFSLLAALAIFGTTTGGVLP